MSDFFDHIAISSDVGFDKPGPEIFRLTLERLKVEPTPRSTSVIATMMLTERGRRVLRQAQDERLRQAEDGGEAQPAAVSPGQGRVISTMEELPALVDELLAHG